MDKYLEQIRQALKDADLADEEREAAEVALTAIEDGLEESAEERSSDATSESASEVDLSPIVEAFQDVGRTLAEGQVAVLAEIKTMREEVNAREVEEDTEEADVVDSVDSREVDDSSAKVEEALADMRKLVEEALPVRRGAGPDMAEEPEPLDEAARVEAALEGIEHPELRLRAVFNHLTGVKTL